MLLEKGNTLVMKQKSRSYEKRSTLSLEISVKVFLTIAVKINGSFVMGAQICPQNECLIWR